MPETRVAKLFRNGASQAVRLPAEFRFDGSEVHATRDERTGDVVLSAHPGSQAWSAFFAARDKAAVPARFMADRPMNRPPVERKLFGHDD